MTAAANRTAMPTIAALVDEARAVFGADQVAVLCAVEGGQELGRLDELRAVVPALPDRVVDVPVAPVPSWKRGRK